MFEGNIFVLVVLGVLIGTVVAAIAVMAKLNSAAVRDGYRSYGAYLRAVPRSDAEKRDAVDLALSGLVLCILGIALNAIFLLGLYPFYWGARKVAYSSLGLGGTQ